jgi:hypothetical protein
MLTHHSFVTLELNPKTGQMEPVLPAQLWEETCGFTVPPNGLPAMFREEWQQLRKRNLATGMAVDLAWLRATEAVEGRQAKFRDKARKRFFRV